MQRTEPPAASTVGTGAVSIRQERSMRRRCAGGEVSGGVRGHHEALAFAPGHLEAVAEEASDLLLGELHDLAAALPQRSQHPCPFGRVPDHLGAHHGDVGPHAHQHVRGVDRHSVGIGRMEQHRLDAEVGADL